MNVYYILAILFLALSAFFGYIGANYSSKQSDDTQIKKISKRFDELGVKISEIQSGSNGKEALVKFNKEYKALAKEYLEILPQKAQQLKVDSERQKLNEIQRSREIQKIVDYVTNTLQELVDGFRSEGATVNFERMAFPSNIFSNENFQLKLTVNEDNYWSIHIVDRELDKIGLMFVRIERNDLGRENLTNDSIVFRWVGTDRYGFSLNGRLSIEARENVFEGLDSGIHPLTQAETDLKRLLINLVKYELARKKG